MRFKIISAGWDCAQFINRTLRSVESQHFDDWDIMIVDDATEDPNQARVIRDWCDPRIADGDDRWHYRINDEHLGTVRNQYEGIKLLNPTDEDIIVFLDLDGDQLADNHVLDRLREYYEDGTLVTYGSYRPIPDVGTSTPAVPFPRHVVKTSMYREYILNAGPGFNHLRTMKGEIFLQIPEDQFKWPHSDEWYQHGTDYIFMVAALELACGRYKCIKETLLLYNHDNPNADYLIRGHESSKCTQNYLRRAPLVAVMPVPLTVEDEVCMYASRYACQVLIETGNPIGEIEHDFTEVHTTDELPPVLETLGRKRALVWLNDVTKEHLEALWSCPVRHVIVFNEFNGVPSLQWVQAGSQAYGWDYELRDSLVRLIPQEL